MIIEAVLTRSPVPARNINPDIPPRLEEIINKALHKDREQRYQHAADIRTDLQQLQRNTDSGTVSGWRTVEGDAESALISTTSRLHSDRETENTKFDVANRCPPPRAGLEDH